VQILGIFLKYFSNFSQISGKFVELLKTFWLILEVDEDHVSPEKLISGATKKREKTAPKATVWWRTDA
jgi:hypothetical protein